MCKWNAFTIDSTGALCKYELSDKGKHLPPLTEDKFST
jgi:hypothetical protein